MTWASLRCGICGKERDVVEVPDKKTVYRRCPQCDAGVPVVQKKGK